MKAEVTRPASPLKNTFSRSRRGLPRHSVATAGNEAISNAEGRMMNEEKAATDFARFVSFLHSSFFIVPSE